MKFTAADVINKVNTCPDGGTAEAQLRKELSEQMPPRADLTTRSVGKFLSKNIADRPTSVQGQPGMLKSIADKANDGKIYRVVFND